MKDNWDKLKSALEICILVAVFLGVILFIIKFVIKHKGGMGGETEVLGGDGRPIPSHLVAMTANNAPRSVTITFVPVGPLSGPSNRLNQTTQQQTAAPTAAEAA